MKRILSFALALVMTLSLAACGVKNTAEPAIMRLFRAEGRVSVTDGDGADVSLRDDLDLFSGYGVRTRSESCAWFDLDDGNRIKMDQNSRITVEKEGRDLEIRLRSGSLFFTVTEPPEVALIRAATTDKLAASTTPFEASSVR